MISAPIKIKKHLETLRQRFLSYALTPDQLSKRLDLSGKDATGCCLDDFVLPSSSFRNANLSHASIRRAKINLNWESVQGMQLEGADLSGSMFQFSVDLRRSVDVGLAQSHIEEFLELLSHASPNGREGFCLTIGFQMRHGIMRITLPNPFDLKQSLQPGTPLMQFLSNESQAINLPAGGSAAAASV